VAGRNLICAPVMAALLMFIDQVIIAASRKIGRIPSVSGDNEQVVDGIWHIA
jgi:hypothetical protein